LDVDLSVDGGKMSRVDGGVAWFVAKGMRPDVDVP
jgi:hypothetical protein